MRFYQIQQFEMLQSVAGMLKSNQDELSAKVPALRTIICGFVEKQEGLYQYYVANNKAAFTSALQKKSIREALIDVVMKITGVLRAHHFQNKNTMPSKVKPAENKSSPAAPTQFTFTYLNRATAETLCKISEQVISKAKKNKYLEHYGISSEDMKDAEAYYKEFAANKEAPKLRKKETALRNKQLAAGMKEHIAILENTIDPLMRIALKDNFELSENYKSFRKVLPRAQGRPSDKEINYRKSRERKKGDSGDNG